MAEAPARLNPFPGLRPFEPEEDYLFFGRDEHLSELLGRLREHRLIAVVGASGSGKSSLVRAGLLPSLHGGFMVGAGSRWRIALLRPGQAPVRNLARALAACGLGEAVPEAGLEPHALIEATLRRSTSGLVDTVRLGGLEAGENVLIVADQFEELFRYRQFGRTHDEPTAFVQLLLEAASVGEPRIFVVLTMRSDYLGDCAQFHGLPEAINAGLYLIPRLTREQRREAIEGPVAVGGAGIAPRLVNRLLNETGENPDQLPILQHALMRVWAVWVAKAGGDALDFAHYESVGGLAEALARHADEAFGELPDERARKLAAIIFKRLTDKGPDNREVRRPSTMAELGTVCDASQEEVVRIIDAFRREDRCFLMPPCTVALEPSTLVDISHESLIRGWPRLKEWVNEEYQAAAIYEWLAETAQLFEAGRAGLWHDPDLQIALDWQTEAQPTAAWARRYGEGFDAAMGFLERSRAARDEARAEREKERRRRRRHTQAVIAVLAATALIASIFAVLAQRATRTAEQARHRAERLKRDLHASHVRSRISGMMIWTKLFNLLGRVESKGTAQEQAHAKSVHAATSQSVGWRRMSEQKSSEAVELDPDNFDARRVLAIELVVSGKAAEALTHLDHALRLAPARSDLHLLRAMALAEQASFDESRQALRLAEKQYHPFNELLLPLVSPEIRRVTGQNVVSVDGAEFVESVRFAQLVLDAGTDAAAFVRRAGQANAPLHKVTNDAWFMAANLTCVWMEHSPERYGLLAAEGWAFENAELPQEATRCYARLAKAHAERHNAAVEPIAEWARRRTAALAPQLPGDFQLEPPPEPKTEMEMLLEILDFVMDAKLDEALVASNRYIGHSPQSVNARLIRSFVLRARKEWAGARSDAEILIAAAPTSAMGHRLLASALVNADPPDPLAAWPHLQKMFELDPTEGFEADVLISVAEALAKTDRPAAIKLLEAGLQVRGLEEPARLHAALAAHLRDVALHQAAGLCDCATSYAKRGNTETALSLYLTAIKSFEPEDVPRDPAIEHAIGAILPRISWLVESHGDRQRAVDLWSSLLGANAFARYRQLVAAEISRLGGSPPESAAR